MSINEDMQPIVDLLGVPIERLLDMRDRFQEREHFWNTIGAWKQKPKDWVDLTPRDPMWDGIPDTTEDFLKKSWVPKEKRLVLENGVPVERYRVVLMTELEQMARDHLGVKGRGKPSVTVQLKALDEVFDEVLAVCGRKPIFRRKDEEGGGRGGMRKETGPLVPVNDVATKQMLLVQFLTGKPANVSNLVTLNENREKARAVPRKERDARRARAKEEKARRQRTN